MFAHEICRFFFSLRPGADEISIRALFNVLRN